MKDFLLKILEAIINALAELFEAFNYDKRIYKKPARPPSVSQPPVIPPVAPVQAEKPPVNVLVPVEMEIGSDEPPLYKKYKSVLTFRERILLNAIRKAVKDEYIVLMKVRMGDFVYLSNEPKDRKSYVNQVICKHVDFLLCGRFRVEPLLVIELDDSSHKTPDHIERDKVKNDILDLVGLPYLRVELQQHYNTDELRRQIKERVLEEAPLFDSETY